MDKADRLLKAFEKMSGLVLNPGPRNFLESMGVLSPPPEKMDRVIEKLPVPKPTPVPMPGYHLKRDEMGHPRQYILAQMLRELSKDTDES